MKTQPKVVPPLSVISGGASSSLTAGALGNHAQAADHASLTEVTRIYAGAGGKAPFHALGPVSFTLRSGEFFSVVGPSGCGKSTLLDVIAGLNPASGGTVEFEGAVVHDKVPEGVAVVFQEDATFPWLTVYDNAAFGARRAGLPASGWSTRWRSWA
jgi:ABC-type sugar transport system ATPase subunit